MSSRSGLGEYLTSPESFPPSRVINYDEKFVSIYDKYPKASIHALLLPRDPAWNLLHPFEALEDPSFLAEVKEHANSLKASVAGELKRRYGGKEATERDWLNEVKVGIHAHPSMNHLHIHIISVDNFSVSMKTRRHYNAFNTPFFIPLDDFPLSPDDPRLHPGKRGYLRRELRCWKCGEEFCSGNSMAKLKTHLEAEFEEWKKGR
ncbi:aprataxin-like protein [Maublancomyces gigas]|uniref:Aprataxin-like protein n=1 Tax=Discina gigas TaxID=1032678 RepID=A0ABR3GCM7_9PEZI